MYNRTTCDANWKVRPKTSVKITSVWCKALRYCGRDFEETKNIFLRVQMPSSQWVLKICLSCRKESTSLYFANLYLRTTLRIAGTARYVAPWIGLHQLERFRSTHICPSYSQYATFTVILFMSTIYFQIASKTTRE